MRLAEHVIRKLELMMHSFHSTRPWSYTVWMDQIPCVYLFYWSMPGYAAIVTVLRHSFPFTFNVDLLCSIFFFFLR